MCTWHVSGIIFITNTQNQSIFTKKGMLTIFIVMYTNRKVDTFSVIYIQEYEKHLILCVLKCELIWENFTFNNKKKFLKNDCCSSLVCLNNSRLRELNSHYNNWPKKCWIVLDSSTFLTRNKQKWFTLYQLSLTQLIHAYCVSTNEKWDLIKYLGINCRLVYKSSF